jgi:hypothetical protein
MPRKKNPANTLQSKVAAMVAVAQGELQPPANMPLREAAAEFWPAIISSRARAEWLPVDLVVAAQLAECQACIRQESVAVQVEGSVLKNERGTMVANPRQNILEALARREMALMRTLRMGGRIAGDTRDAAGQRRNEHEARLTAAQLADEQKDPVVLLA